MNFNAKVRTCLWFNHNGHEAAEFYVSLRLAQGSLRYLVADCAENHAPHAWRS